jgi:hypothetical protein
MTFFLRRAGEEFSALKKALEVRELQPTHAELHDFLV